jgi:O-acetylhomoserine (thiol)-lyase
LNEPDVSYHGVVYTEALGAAAYIGRARVVPLAQHGRGDQPVNSFLLLQGIETLALRMDRICDNTLAIAKVSGGNTRKWRGCYAGLETILITCRWCKYMGGRASGILSFGLKGGAEAGARFIDALQLFTRLVNIGDAKSLAAIRPAPRTAS